MNTYATIELPSPRRKRTRVAMLTPLPPARTGIAHYVSMILPALSEVVDVEAFGSIEGYRAEDFDATIYQLGNNPHHEWIYRQSMAHPGVIVLHDIVLHHLIVEMTLARGDEEGYVAALRASHGEAGAAWARGRAAGLHSEMGNFLLPASVDLANRSHSVIVHNQWGRDRLRSLGVTTPIHVVPHPYEQSDPASQPREATRAALGFAAADRIIGLFGFLTSAKRSEVVLEAFARARSQEPRLRLLVVGEPAPNVDVESMRGDGITFTGYAEDAEFTSYLNVCDRLVNLRYPSAGETSGTLIRAFAAGKPVAVSDYAQFAELPDSCVTKIPLGAGESKALTQFFLDELSDPAEAQRKWLEENAEIDLVVAGYLAALAPIVPSSTIAAPLDSSPASPFSPPHGEKVPEGRMRGPEPTQSRIALFPAVAAKIESSRIVLTNHGPDTLRTRVYGQPGYRVIIRTHEKGMDRDRWIELPSDLAPGNELSIPIPPLASGRVRLYHALEGIPMLDPEPFASLELPVGAAV